MNILFVHQNMPAQFKHLAPHLAAEGHRVVFLTQTIRRTLPGVQAVTYPAPAAATTNGHPYLRRLEDAVRTGQQVVRAVQNLASAGFQPDLIIAHSGWGEPLFLKEAMPGTPLIVFAEYFYRSRGADVGFDPEEPYTLDTICRTRLKNANLLACLDACDRAVSPTQWQLRSHPPEYWGKIAQIFDGIDLDEVSPRAICEMMLPGGQRIRRGDPIVTFVSRNLEPYRGLRPMLRAVPAMLAGNPDLRIIFVGGDQVSYGGKPPDGSASWREHLVKEYDIASDRVHFVGRLDYATYLDLLSLSRVHVYLTYPFVLSWSCFEAMAMGPLVVASDVAPVREVIKPGYNGLLVDFFDHAALAGQVIDALKDWESLASIRRNARLTIERQYGLDRSLRSWRNLINDVTGGGIRPSRETRFRPPQGTMRLQRIQ
jgi:glycosyltransferase involved in cell wall biosynthesis